MLKSLNKVGWYWHRLRAMTPREIALRLEKKGYQIADRKFETPSGLPLEPSGNFPRLPLRRAAPAELSGALARDAELILRGEWKAFGHLPLAVSDPPKWQADPLVGVDLRSEAVAFKLDHRAQAGGADIKVIWEPSRWYQLVRLAMAAWLLEDGKAQEKCIEWLHDWSSQNPPFTGLNWTSGLETGIRLIQFTWIDAFLTAAGAPNKTLNELRGRILPAHVWYTWRYKSFGSSANNHLIGELAGVIIALARWPALARISAPLDNAGSLLEREILAQFAEDGGNQEQALGYHLFSWEFCFQAQRALEMAGVPPGKEAADRLKAAGIFYASVKPEGDLWDFGDSDNAWVTPFFANESEASREWAGWFRNSARGGALKFWWGDFPGNVTTKNEWQIFASSGYAVLQTDDWFLRLDFSPLGYLSMAPHGHLDALHLSVWFRGEPVVIDPGTGAYYADKVLRNYLAGWSAHNSPQSKEGREEYPRRFGTFLWGEHHAVPRWRSEGGLSITATLALPSGRAERTVTFSPERNAIRVRDQFEGAGQAAVVTRWKFAPRLTIQRAEGNQFKIGPVRFQPSAAWKMSRSYNPPERFAGKVGTTSSAFPDVPLESLVSPAFRAVAAAPYLALESNEAGPFEVLISVG